MRVRFAPSPTGALHIGGARAALYNWLLARKKGGTFRAADRGHRPRALNAGDVEQILDALSWLELDWDKGPSRRPSARRATARRSTGSWPTATPTRTRAPCACGCRTTGRPWSRT